LEPSPVPPVSPPEATPRVPRRLIFRFLILVVLVGTGFALLRWSPLGDYLTGEKLSATIDMLRDSWWAPVALIAAFVILCPLGIPASPMVIAGGVIFGVVLGSFYNILGTFLGAMASYFLGRWLGRDFVVHLAGKRLKKVERAIGRRGFWGLVGVRFLPLPFALVNYCAALAGVRPGMFLVSTLIGLMPTQIIFTYFADTLSRAATGERSGIYLQLGAAGLLLLLLSLVPQIWNGQQRRRKLRGHRDRRRGRGRLD
jgi:uncharacterized membrane protein YdjX (TVP38/TMEM64 family)